MFDKKMEAVQIDVTEDGNIRIIQPEFGREDDSIVIITPDQVDVLIQWLQEAKRAAVSKVEEGK